MKGKISDRRRNLPKMSMLTSKLILVKGKLSKNMFPLDQQASKFGNSELEIYVEKKTDAVRRECKEKSQR